MTDDAHSRDLDRYRRMLVLCPPAFRDEYGDAMVQAFADLSREPRHAGALGRARLWLLSGRDLALTAVAEHTRRFGRAIAGSTHMLSLRTLMIVNAALFIVIGVGIVVGFGPVAWSNAFGLPPDVISGPATTQNVPLGLARLFAVIITAFGALLLAVARVADTRAGSTVAGALCPSYGIGSALLLIQQTQIWLTVSGAATVIVSAMLALGYGTAWLVRRDAVTAPVERPVGGGVAPGDA